MKINKIIKKYVSLSLIIAICVGFTSCDLDKSESENLKLNNDALNERIKVNIEEAKVISDISILNQTIIAFSKLSILKSSDYSVKTISYKLKKDSIEIEKYLKNLADKKLIILPNGLDKKEIKILSNIDEPDFSKAYLNIVKEQLENEITQLNYLASITNDVDYKILTVQLLVKLNYNLNKINKNT